MNASMTQKQDSYEIVRGLPFLARRALVVFAVLAVLSLAILVAGKIYGRTLVHAGHTTSLQRFEVTIGNDGLQLPANMIRDEEQRRRGPARRIELYLHWPTMSGFRPNLAAAFNDVSPETNAIVFISVLPRGTTHDMAGRFEAVYRKVMRGGATSAAHGLTSHALSPDYGYIGERIVFSAPDMHTGKRFVARCQDTQSDEQVVLAPCAMDIHFGDTLVAEIRFPSRLLGDWQMLNQALPRFLDGLLARPS
ncbi:hypothetical protein [Oricola sp.]|uniref:hypothetical protein n=1 Tax=Oricola sp. TaxID=1979950 RepID=UPI003BAADCDD